MRLDNIAVAFALITMIALIGLPCFASDIDDINARTALAVATAMHHRDVPAPAPAPDHVVVPTKKACCTSSCVCGCNAGGECACAVSEVTATAHTAHTMTGAPTFAPAPPGVPIGYAVPMTMQAPPGRMLGGGGGMACGPRG